MPGPLSSARPLTIAHRAGNRLSTLERALAAGVDYAETDVWFHRGRLEVRHDKTAGPLPVLWDRWSLRPGWTPRLLLDDVLAAASGLGRLFIDLKGHAEGTAEAVAEAIARAGMQEGVAFSGQWEYLDRLTALLPEAPRFYTIAKRDRLFALRSRLARREIPAVSIDSNILTEPIVSELKEAGVGKIVTWRVETPATARRVLGWGVSGVTSDSISLLRSIRDGEFAAAKE